MTTFADVTEAIASERRYQDSRWGNTKSSDRPGNGERTIDEFVLYIHGYTVDADTSVDNEVDVTEIMHIIRKIAGLCRACLEQHGDPDNITAEKSAYQTVDFAVDFISGKTFDLVHTASHFGNAEEKLLRVIDVYRACMAAMLAFGAPLREA